MEYKCPICEAELLCLAGTKLDKDDGITLMCPNLKCPVQEVMGHGLNEIKAYEVIKQKFLPR